MNYKQMLQCKFKQELKAHKVIFEKLDTPHIVLYKWEDGFAYRAPYKCLPSKEMALEEMCYYIENKFNVIHKRGEFYMFTEQVKRYVAKDVVVRLLSYHEVELLEEMKAECASSEVNLAQIMIDDIHVLGAFVEGKLVGVSSILDLWNTYDIGILVHPKYRKRGISSMLVSENARWVLAQNKLCMYRCDDFNTGSIRTAKKLGFSTKVEVVVYEIKEE
ncbi:MAG: GNAT family N-acetyltransferase [Erysipelotrichia bacterium]|nr:GNAT family N-acetyltransferase [Erysipelotrichia bacterium]NCC55199.1 GNAT family N-acetyltransferase [Erysipelotrichia bacterium]